MNEHFAILTPFYLHRAWERKQGSRDPTGPARVAGVDVSYRENAFLAALVIMNREGRGVVKVKISGGQSPYPYRSGLFFLKEGPLITGIIEGEAIDLLFVNGHGLCHPHGWGLATVVGYLSSVSTIGVARGLIKDSCDSTSPVRPGVTAIFRNNKACGLSVLRAGFRRPLFLSPGFGVSLDQTLTEYESWTTMGRFPEPLRLAHLYSRRPCGT